MMKKSQIALLMLTITGSGLPGARSVELMAQQTPDANWEQAAGGKMEFAVASVRLNKGPTEPSNFQLSPDDVYAKTGGLLIADSTLETYITFAYKFLPTREQFQSLFGKLPDWVRDDHYEIQARAPQQNPTKDQMRLMMQSLLKERFGLVVHYETQDSPVMVMSFVKQGKLGPNLLHHEDGPPCNVVGKPPEAAPMDLRNKDVFPAVCGTIEGVPTTNEMILLAGRNVSFEMMAQYFAAGHLGRPIVVQPGMTGDYDFRLSWMPEPGAFGRPPISPTQDDSLSAPQGPTFLDAVHDQLGLSLREGKAALPVLVIDHVERPSEN